MKPLDPVIRTRLRPARAALVVATLAGTVGGLLLILQAFAVGNLIVGLARGESVTARSTGDGGGLRSAWRVGPGGRPGHPASRR